MKKVLVLIALICNFVFANPVQIPDFFAAENFKHKINIAKVSKVVIKKHYLFAIDLNLDNYRMNERHGAFLLIVRF